MTAHLIAKGMSQIDASRDTLGEKIDAEFESLKASIGNGDREAQALAASAMHGLAHTALNLAHAARSLLPAIALDKGEAQSAEDAAAKGRKRA